MVALRKWEASFDLPVGVEAPRAARDAIGAVLRVWGFRDRDWLAQARIVVSELASNAVVHARGWLTVDVQVHDARVTVGAADGSSACPRRVEPRKPAGGRGIALIEAIAVRWGVDHQDSGKRVWAQLPPHPAGARSTS